MVRRGLVAPIPDHRRLVDRAVAWLGVAPGVADFHTALLHRPTTTTVRRTCPIRLPRRAPTRTEYFDFGGVGGYYYETNIAIMVLPRSYLVMTKAAAVMGGDCCGVRRRTWPHWLPTRRRRERVDGTPELDRIRATDLAI